MLCVRVLHENENAKQMYGYVVDLNTESEFYRNQRRNDDNDDYDDFVVT